MAVKKDPREIQTAEPFRSLFPVEEDVLALVVDSMRETGFDSTKPLLMWRDAFGERGRSVLVDGHTRLAAALRLKLPEVWATVRQYPSVDAAITAGIGEQVQRRNLNREQIAAYVVSLLPHLDETRGGLRTRTAKQLARLLGVSVPTIDRARGVLASGDDDLIADVKAGRKSLLAAYTETTNGPVVIPGQTTVAEQLAEPETAEETRVVLEPNEAARARMEFNRMLAEANESPADGGPDEDTLATLIALANVISSLDLGAGRLDEGEDALATLELPQELVERFLVEAAKAYEALRVAMEMIADEVVRIADAHDVTDAFLRAVVRGEDVPSEFVDYMLTARQG